MATLEDYKAYIGDPFLPYSATSRKLWSHQKTMLKWALSHDASLLYSGMSTGKTGVALLYLEQFPGLKVVISPAKPMGVYADDYADFFRGRKPYKLYVLDASYGNARKRFEFLQSIRHESAVVVMSYEIASHMPLAKLGVTAVVADEAHRLGSHNGKQSMRLAVACNGIKNKLAMTGTAFEDGYERLYGIMRWLDPFIPANKNAHPQAAMFGHYDEFLNDYCVLYVKGSIKYIKGYKNLPQLAAAIRDITLLVRTEDVIDLPEMVLRRHRFELEDHIREHYNSLRDDAIIELPDDETILAPHVLARTTRLQQLISSGVLETESGDKHVFDMRSRPDKLAELVDELGAEPVVIFTRFIRDIALIRSVLLAANRSCAVLDGSTDESRLWLNGTAQYLIANVASGSEGLRLQRAHHVIMWSLGYSLKQWRQAIARVRRHGQKSGTVFVHTLVAYDTIDERIYEVLDNKLQDVLDLDRELIAPETAS